MAEGGGQMGPDLGSRLSVGRRLGAVVGYEAHNLSKRLPAYALRHGRQPLATDHRHTVLRPLLHPTMLTPPRFSPLPEFLSSVPEQCGLPGFANGLGGRI